MTRVCQREPGAQSAIATTSPREATATTTSRSRSPTTDQQRVSHFFYLHSRGVPSSTLTRPTIAFRGLGHVLAISRGLSTFDHPEADTDAMSTDSGSKKGIIGEENGLKWSANVGHDLTVDEQCLFDSVGQVIYLCATVRSAS